MTHIPSRDVLGPSSSSRTPLSRSLGDNRRPIEDRLAACRSDIAALEAAWTLAAEQAIARHIASAIRLADRATWDRATWRRYLAAAATLEADFKPRLRAFHQQADMLDRLLAMPKPTRAA